MKKFLMIICCGCLLTFMSVAQVSVTYPDDFAEGWDKYVGKTVTFENRFYLGGFNSADGYYTDMALFTDMRREPMDVATPGTTAYDEAEAASDALWNDQVHLTFDDGSNYMYLLERIGSYVDGLTARVEGECRIRMSSYADVDWQPGRPTQRPDLGEAELVVCASNLQAFSPFLDAFKSDGAPQTQEEADLKTAKVLAALRNMDADIYAFCELQDTSTVVNFIADRLNEAYGQPGLYAAVDDGVKPAQIGAGRTGYVYRTTKVKPVGTLGRPDAGDYVYGRHQYVLQFEQLSNGGRFAFSINHFKAKSGADNGDARREENMRNLINYLNTAPSLDDDVLVMGDLNAYAKEKPLLMLEDEGYTNLLAEYNPEGFSYVYQNKVGNMDHALISTSLVSQVTGAAVYQINAEESHHYKIGGEMVSDDMYGYADHNPVLVGLNLEPESERACEDIDYSETFSSSLGAFTSVNVKGGNDWYCDSQYHYALMNGYKLGGDNEDWLVSPAFDLTGKTRATLAFQHAINYADIPNLKNNHTLWVTDAYTGDPTTTTWKQVTIPDYPAGNSWSWKNANLALPSEYEGKENVVFAFKYLCEDGKASAWEIKNLTFKAACAASGVESVLLAEKPGVFVSGRNIYMYNLSSGTQVVLYDVTGRIMASVPVTEHTVELPVYTSGMYMLTVAGHSYKIMIR